MLNWIFIARVIRLRMISNIECSNIETGMSGSLHLRARKLPVYECLQISYTLEVQPVMALCSCPTGFNYWGSTQDSLPAGVKHVQLKPERNAKLSPVNLQINLATASTTEKNYLFSILDWNIFMKLKDLTDFITLQVICMDTVSFISCSHWDSMHS